MTRKRTLSWRAKLALLLVAFSVAPVVALAAWEYTLMVETFEKSRLGSLEALANAKADAIDQFTDLRKRDAERIAGLVAPHLVELTKAKKREAPGPAPEEPLPALEDAEAIDDKGEDAPSSEEEPSETSDADSEPPATTRAGNAHAEAATGGYRSPVEQAQSSLKQVLALVLWDQKDFEELLVLDSTGQVVASTFADHEGRTAKDLDYFQSGRKVTYVQPVFVSPITGELTMVIASPIRDEELNQVGVIAARLNLKRFYHLIDDSTGLGSTGETVVGKVLDEEIAFMAPTRHDADAALNRTIPVGSPHADALQEAARGQAGAGRQIDYRGEPTLAAWQYVPSLDWGLIVKMDTEEALAPLDAAQRRLLVITLIILLLVVPTSVAAAQALVRPLRRLKEATDRISRGDLTVDLDMPEGDEFGELADSFDRMVAAIKFFREKSQLDRDEPPDDGELTPRDDEEHPLEER